MIYDLLYYGRMAFQRKVAHQKAVFAYHLKGQPAGFPFCADRLDFLGKSGRKPVYMNRMYTPIFSGLPVYGVGSNQDIAPVAVRILKTPGN